MLYLTLDVIHVLITVMAQSRWFDPLAAGTVAFVALREGKAAWPEPDGESGVAEDAFEPGA
jgi:hypothetical protein